MQESQSQIARSEGISPSRVHQLIESGLSKYRRRHRVPAPPKRHRVPHQRRR